MLYKKGETAHSEHLHRAPRATGDGVSVEGKAHSALGEQLGEPLEAATQGTTHCNGAGRCAEDGAQGAAHGGSIEHTELKWS